MPPAVGSFLWKRQREVEEQCRLQRPCDDVRPVDRPVKGVELGAGVKGVQHERRQAEEIEVGRARCRPATEKDIQADQQVDERDQPLLLVLAAPGRFQHDRRVDANVVADEDVIDALINPSAEPLAN
jgi:hypothetical protein